ncbi:FimV/HubP family polar landmark protein [Salinisphaera japonica]|uniref:FimV/HubP family polar landmark protein n=1 Tax=Salinisphaera japonica TaxID=1304270 RepID=UPI000F4AF803|nr:FimV/HubP family polar landmark protein [Salinisphaera japonica]
MQHRAGHQGAGGIWRWHNILGAAVLLLAGLPGLAHALSFSGIQVNSALGEPFAATFELRQVGPDESLNIGMASTERFEQLGIPRPAFIDRLRFATGAEGGDQLQVRIDSARPINEPFFSFVVRVDTASGGALHEYTAFLDPADSTTPATGPAATPAERTTRPAERAEMPAAYSVRAGDTLWRIAGRYQPPGASAAQTAWAIYKANPEALAAGPSSLRQGARLSVPDDATIKAVSRQRAQTGLETPTTDAPHETAPAVAATGEAPPPPEAMATLPDTGTPQTVTSNRGAAETAGAVDAPGAAFGTLIIESDTPWPETAAPAARAAPFANTPPEPSRTDAPAQTSASTPPPATAPVRRDAGPGLLRPRNLVIILVLFLLAMLWLRQRDKNKQSLSMMQDDAAGTRASASRAAPRSARQTEPEQPAWLAGTTNRATPSSRATVDDTPPAGSVETRDVPAAPPPESRAPAPQETERSDAGDNTSSPVPGLTFQPTTIRPVERRHDRGAPGDTVVFDGSATAGTGPGRDAPVAPRDSKADHEAREPTVDLIDPEAFDLYDTPSSSTDAGAAATNDSIRIRLDLARMYIDMSDPESARELLLDVQARGDESQREHAERLLGEI